MFAYRLAREMKCLNVDAMLSQISDRQFREWEAFYLLEPWGYEVENFRMAQMCATVANFAGRMLRDGQRMTAEDFMPRQRHRAGRTAADLSAEIDASFKTLLS